MKIQDILSFDKESYFNGAVQADWFYDERKAQMISSAYVFHGPRYFGVGEKDIDSAQHKLLDTARFAELIANRGKQRSNNFIMTIAGYGMGKSHLAVTLGCLLSGHNTDIQDCIIHNIDQVDKSIAKNIRDNVEGTKNLIIVLNGMNNFNLDYEILSCVRKALSQHGIDESVLKDVTKAYSVAHHFLLQTFDLMRGQYVEYSRKHNLGNIPEASLKDYLAASVETDERAFNVIDEVFNLTNGHRIQWENGLSAKEIISFVEKKFIIENKTFERIIIIFDEFGRFLEYAAQHPNEAGDSALQQIFETIQNSNGKILHVAFIQSELSAYLKRIDKTGNIERYVGRYEASDKYYLSSNFETILANLIKGKDKKEFAQYISRPFYQNKRYYSYMQQALNRWVKGSNGKYVWSNEDAFINVVCEGCYPLHPYTTWILGNLSNWMQQRSTISFAAEMFEQIKEYIIHDDANFQPSIRPSDIIESSIFHEMVNSEEKGMVQSEYCLLYQSIITKLKDQITDKERNVLNAVLITNIGRFECFAQSDAIVAVSYCACLSKTEAAHHLESLEKQYGVVTFNAAAKRYVLVAEATGRNDYQRALLKKKMLTYKRTDLSAIDEEIEKYLKLDAYIETPFALENNISGYEWRFEKRLVDVSDLDTKLYTWVSEFDTAYDAEHIRGLLIFAYDNAQDDTTRSIVSIFNKHKLSEKPIVIIVLKDRDNQLIDCLEEYSALKSFSVDERAKFATFFNPDMKNCMVRLGQVFNSLQSAKNVVSVSGIQPNSLRLTSICNEQFKTCFTKAISFNFDGFEKKLTSTVRKYVNEVASNLGNQTVIDTTSFNMLAPDVKNRIKGLLFDGNVKSWKIINNNLNMHMPQNTSVAEIFTTSYEIISCNDKASLKELFFKYLLPPYGLNQYSLTLLIFSFLCFYKDSVVIERDGEKINLSSISSIVFSSAKLQLQTLLKLNTRLLVKTDNDLISSLCENIVNNQSVEQCSRLQEQLFSTLEKGDVPEELGPAISAAKLKLKEGETLSKSLEKRMEEVNDGIQQLKNKFNLRLAVTLLDKLDNCEGTIGENTSYVYSYIFTERSRKIQSELKKMIEIQGSNYIQRMGCSDITQLSQFESACKKIAEKLCVYGFSQLAEELLQRIEYVKNHIVTEQKYQNVLVDYERYEKAKLPLNARREECNQAIQTAKEWISFWENASDYDSKKREKIIIALTEKVEQISELINNKEKDMLASLEAIPKVFEESTMYQALRKLEQDLSFGFDNSVIDKANYYLDKEAAYTTFWERAAKSFSDFIQCSSSFEEEEWYVLPFSNFADDRRQYIEQQYQEKAIQWMQKHPLPSEQELEEYSEKETEQLVSSLKTLPDYLSGKDIKRVNDFLEYIYARNEKGKVLSIERTFVELSKQNQQECIARLTALFNADDVSEQRKEDSSEMEQDYNKPKMKNVEFTEDEMILLLHVYMLHRDEWFTAQKDYVIELSNLYRTLPIHSDELRKADNFRNPAGIDLQLRSLAKCDPSDYHRQKLVASAAMRKVWSEYANNMPELHDKVIEIVEKYGIDTSRYPTLF